MLLLANKLDAENLTPSDYALIAYNLPIDKSEEELKELVMERFTDLKESINLEIVYINYTYNIEEFIQCTTKLTEMYRRRGLVKKYRKEAAKEQGLDPKVVKEQPDLVPPPPPVNVGICKKIELQMEEIENDIIDLKEKIQKWEENLSVDTSINLYNGVAFIVFQKPTHAHAVLNS